MAQATTTPPLSRQARSEVDPRTTLDLALTLFDVVRHTRRTRGTDAIEPAATVVLAAADRLAPARPSDIATELHLDLSTVSRHLSRLEEDGPLERLADEGDRRCRRVAPTAHGRQALLDVLANRAATLDSALSSWSSKDRHQLGELLKRLAHDLENAS
ncbi:MAG TPA: hypothetical protein DHW34_00925 [Actinobacteria bacterium]|nr:hypothetical protein [Actinomycetota bacterium]